MLNILIDRRFVVEVVAVAKPASKLLGSGFGFLLGGEGGGEACSQATVA